MMPSPSIYTYSNARHSCRLSAGIAQARIAALHSIAVTRPILSRYTHRIAISNRRLVSAGENGVTFKYKDYRIEGPAR